MADAIRAERSGRPATVSWRRGSNWEATMAYQVIMQVTVQEDGEHVLKLSHPTWEELPEPPDFEPSRAPASEEIAGVLAKMASRAGFYIREALVEKERQQQSQPV
jgi:hypothetical protein